MMASGLLSKLVYWRSKIMAKKFKGEDGKVYVQKKPIYKRWWFLLLAVAVIGSLATGGGDDEAATDTAANETEIAANETETEAPAEAASSEVPTEEAINTFKADYNSIAIGDSLSNGEGGMTYDAAVAKYGEPDSNSESSFNDTTTKISTWTNVGGKFLDTLVITFSNGNATGKGFTGFSFNSDAPEATLEAFNAVPTDGSYTFDQAIAQFGEPDSASESLFGGQYNNIVGWSSNVKGDFGANFNLTVTDGVVTGKAQFNMQ